MERGNIIAIAWIFPSFVRVSKVLGVYLTGDGNSGEIPHGAEETVCRVNQADECIFLVRGRGGFICKKFESVIARVLLDDLAKGRIPAGRIGNCAVVGRKDRQPVST